MAHLRFKVGGGPDFGTDFRVEAKKKQQQQQFASRPAHKQIYSGPSRDQIASQPQPAEFPGGREYTVEHRDYNAPPQSHSQDHLQQYQPVAAAASDQSPVVGRPRRQISQIQQPQQQYATPSQQQASDQQQYAPPQQQHQYQQPTYSQEPLYHQEQQPLYQQQPGGFHHQPNSMSPQQAHHQQQSPHQHYALQQDDQPHQQYMAPTAAMGAAGHGGVVDNLGSTQGDPQQAGAAWRHQQPPAQGQNDSGAAPWRQAGHGSGGGRGGHEQIAQAPPAGGGQYYSSPPPPPQAGMVAQPSGVYNFGQTIGATGIGKHSAQTTKWHNMQGRTAEQPAQQTQNPQELVYNALAGALADSENIGTSDYYGFSDF